MASRALSALILAIVVVAMASPAWGAEPVDAASRSTARKLGQEAVKLFEAGDYPGALDKFNTADSLVPAPTLGLYAARCLVKLGRLVEASERYLEVTRMQLDRNAIPVMRKAQAEAVAERDKLLPSIPSLEIRLEGPQGSGVDVLVEGKPLLPGLLGEKRPVNPGKYRIEAKRTDAAVTEDVVVIAGTPARVVLKLPPLPPPPAGHMPALRMGGWAAIGVAGAGVIVGGVSGLVALAKGQGLLLQCPNHVCTSPATYTGAGAYDAARVASTVGFITGGVALAVGIPILVVSPKVEYAYPDGRPAPPPKDQASLPRIEVSLAGGPTGGGAGLRGIF
jgi:hypothetical protein